MATLRTAPVATFTIGFTGEHDETPFADAIARRYCTAHHSELDAAIDYIGAARTQARIYGEPFADSSSVPTHRLSAMTRRHVTVALSGDGGDELFAGYRRYQWHQIAEAVRTFLPSAMRRGIFAELARVYPRLARAPRWLRAKSTLTEISLDSALGYYRMLCKAQDHQRRSLFSQQLLCDIDGHEPANRISALMTEADTDDPISQAQYVDIKSYLVGDILTKVDRASMAVSLEVRAPLLHHEFVDWATTLPPSMSLRAGRGKYIFKRALEDQLPASSLYRRKQGFATSLAERFRGSGALRVRQRLLGEQMLCCGLFDHASLAQLLDTHARGNADHTAVIWSLLVFEGFLEVTAGTAPPPVSASEARSFAESA
jgi:asparagine synthase (glutamine-hydrolysing)